MDSYNAQIVTIKAVQELIVLNTKLSEKVTELEQKIQEIEKN